MLERVEAIISAASADEQRRLFTDVEALARRQGLGDEIDSWGPDVVLLRGGD